MNKLIAAICAAALAAAGSVFIGPAVAGASEPIGCPADAVTLPSPDGPASCAKCPTGMVTIISPAPQRGIVCEAPGSRRNPAPSAID